MIDRARVLRVAELASEGQLGEAALEYAGFAHPDLDPGPYLARLDEMAALVEGDSHLALRRVVSIREGLGGDIDSYYDPRNSYLNHVLDRRKGIPITLAVVWMEVGRRAGIDVRGVALPGHFLVYAAGQLVDPFHGGEAIGADEAKVLVAENFGGPPRLNPEWLEPAPPVTIVERMLRNLSEAYRRRGEEEPQAWISACREALTPSLA